jgi:hypothetical protein
VLIEVPPSNTIAKKISHCDIRGSWCVAGELRCLPYQRVSPCEVIHHLICDFFCNRKEMQTTVAVALRGFSIIIITPPSSTHRAHYSTSPITTPSATKTRSASSKLLFHSHYGEFPSNRSQSRLAKSRYFLFYPLCTHLASIFLRPRRVCFHFCSVQVKQSLIHYSDFISSLFSANPSTLPVRRDGSQAHARASKQRYKSLLQFLLQRRNHLHATRFNR